AGESVAVVDQQGSAGQVQVGLGEADHAGRGRHDPGAGGHRDVEPEVRAARFAVQDALAAVDAADAAAFDRADEAAGEVLAGIVAFARLADRGLFAGDALGDLRVGSDGLLRQAVDALDAVLAGPNVDGPLQ